MNQKKPNSELYPYQGQFGHWAYAEYEEGPFYADGYETKEEAIEEGFDAFPDQGGIHVGQLVEPSQPWEEIDGEDFVDCVNNSDAFLACADWFEWGVDITKEQESELTEKLQAVCKEWCEKHGHTTKHFLVENSEWIEEPKKNEEER